MIEVILDASQIEVFEACPRKWYYDHIRNLTLRKTNPALSTGSFFHEVLRTYYENGQAAPPCSRHIREAVNYAIQISTDAKWPKVAADPKFYIDRLRSYLVNHMWEDDSSQIIAVEKGFSTLLYEDVDRRYLLEGMIDLVSIEASTGLTITDHKTQSRFYDKYGYNHQALNYLSFTGAKYFRYNYIGLQDKEGDNTFRRPIFRPADGVLEQWRRDVLRTFQQMEYYLTHGDEGQYYGEGNPQEIQFPRRRSSCDGKFGVCQFHRICETPDDSKWLPTVLTAYKEKEILWRAWS